MKSNSVIVSNLFFKYSGQSILNNINFNGDKGDLIALVGENGVGKSTLLKLLAGILKPSLGKIEINGNIGWMPEKGSPDKLLTVEEFLKFASYLKNNRDISMSIDSCGLRSHLHTKCGELSGGTLRKVMLAVAIIGNPDILLLDEPSGGLDPIFQKEFSLLLKKLAEDKVVFISTHNISEIKDLATRIFLVKDRGIKELSPKEYCEYF